MANLPNGMASTMLAVDTVHDDMIHDAQMDYYGLHLATCSSDKTVKIFDVTNNTYNLLQTLDGHEGPVWQVAWAHPSYGNILASCSYDKTIIIWTASNKVWEKSYTYNDHDSSVNSVCWAPYQYGLMLVCGSSDGAISVLTSSGDGQWSAKKINNAHTIGCNAVSWEPAGASALILNSLNANRSLKEDQVKRFASGGCDNLIKIWKLNEDEEWIEEQKLEGHSDWVRDVAWAPSVGLTENIIASCSQDGRVILWMAEVMNDSKTGGDIGKIEEKWIAKTLNVYDDVVWHVSWNITGTLLAVSGGDNKVSLWKESFDGHWSSVGEINRGVVVPTIPKSEPKPEMKVDSKLSNKVLTFKAELKQETQFDKNSGTNEQNKASTNVINKETDSSIPKSNGTES